MSPVCASIDIIPLRRDKIELKSKTGYYLSAKTFCLEKHSRRPIDLLCRPVFLAEIRGGIPLNRWRCEARERNSADALSRCFSNSCTVETADGALGRQLLSFYELVKELIGIDVVTLKIRLFDWTSAIMVTDSTAISIVIAVVVAVVIAVVIAAIIATRSIENVRRDGKFAIETERE